MWLHTYGKRRSYIEREKHYDFQKERKWKKGKWISFNRLSSWEADTNTKKEGFWRQRREGTSDKKKGGKRKRN